MYEIIIERTGNGFSAYVEGLPGCIAAGETEDETMQLIWEGIELHREMMDAEHNCVFNANGYGVYQANSSMYVDASRNNVSVFTGDYAAAGPAGALVGVC